MIVRLCGCNGVIINAKIGFSWTVFFFGFLVPIYRGDAKWAVIMFAASLLTVFMAQLIFSFTYNRTYIRELLLKGYVPYDDYSRKLLIANGFIAG